MDVICCLLNCVGPINLWCSAVKSGLKCSSSVPKFCVRKECFLFFFSPSQTVCSFLSAYFIYKTYSTAETVVFDSHPSRDNRRIFIKHKAFIYCSTHMVGFILHLPKECATKIKRSFCFPPLLNFVKHFGV